MPRLFPRAPLGAALLCLAVAPALAHVTARPNEGAASAYFQTALTVSHGCEGSATVAIRVRIPESVLSVKPQMKPGWRVEIRKRRLDPPVKGPHGQPLTEVVEEVEWRGGPLPDDLYDTFGLLLKLPDAAGQTLYFPLVQECEHGTRRWVEIPTANQKWGDLHDPAPFVKVTNAP